MVDSLTFPLRFIPVYKDYLWGGTRIPALFHRKETPVPCAESWEISAHPEGESVVAEGPCKGMTLAALAQRYGTGLIGSLANDPTHFPLLFKIIDAKQALSVQIHPNEKNAGLTGGEPKTEMWTVLGCEPGAEIFAGFHAGVTAESLQKAMDQKKIADQLVRLAAMPGKALFIPGGLVHAIGAGCLIYEVQQSSNTTYRFYDWDRVGKDGKPRELHVAACGQTIDWSLPPPSLITGTVAQEEGGNVIEEIVRSPFFTQKRFRLNTPMTCAGDGSTFHALFLVQGAVHVAAGGVTMRMQPGESLLIPAGCDRFALLPEYGDSELLVTTL